MKKDYESWLEWSIINSITSGANVTLSVLFQCRWLKLYMYFYVFFSEYIKWLFLVIISEIKQEQIFFGAPCTHEKNLLIYH